jgi:hypothetical protein
MNTKVRIILACSTIFLVVALIAVPKVVRADPSNNPNFTTFSDVSRMISDALAPISSSIQNLNSRVSNLETVVSSLPSQVQGLQNSVATHSAQIYDLQNRITNLESMVAALQEQSSQVNIQVANNVRVASFQLQGRPEDQIQARRIRFAQTGTISSSQYRNIRLVNSDTGYVLATLAAPSANYFEFNLRIDGSKPDFGVVVNWHRYIVIADFDDSSVDKTFQASIQSPTDIDTFYYTNDNLPFPLDSSLNTFPIKGTLFHLN